MSNDAKIAQYRDAVEQKRNELGTKPKLAYGTNALLDLGGTKINLNTLGSEEECVRVASQLLAQEQLTKLGNEALGTKVDLKFGDFTVAQWIADLKLRVSAIIWERKKQKLAAMDTQLKALMSEDARTAGAIADIAKQLED